MTPSGSPIQQIAGSISICIDSGEKPAARRRAVVESSQTCAAPTREPRGRETYERWRCGGEKRAPPNNGKAQLFLLCSPPPLGPPLYRGEGEASTPPPREGGGWAKGARLRPRVSLWAMWPPLAPSPMCMGLLAHLEGAAALHMGCSLRNGPIKVGCPHK